MDNFGTRVERLMKEKGVTQVEIAEATNVRRPSFSEWKKTGVVPAGDVCYKIAQYLDTTVEYLVAGKQTSKSSIDKAQRDIIIKEYLESLLASFDSTT